MPIRSIQNVIREIRMAVPIARITRTRVGYNIKCNGASYLANESAIHFVDDDPILQLVRKTLYVAEDAPLHW